MGQSIQTLLRKLDQGLQEQVLLAESKLQSRVAELTQVLKERYGNQTEYSYAIVYSDPENEESSEKIKDVIRSHIHPALVQKIEDKFFEKLNTIAVDQTEIINLYGIAPDLLSAHAHYTLASEDISNGARVALITYSITKRPFSNVSLSVTLSVLTESSPNGETKSLILNRTKFQEDPLKA